MSDIITIQSLLDGHKVSATFVLIGENFYVWKSIWAAPELRGRGLYKEFMRVLADPFNEMLGDSGHGGGYDLNPSHVDPSRLRSHHSVMEEYYNRIVLTGVDPENGHPAFYTPPVSDPSPPTEIPSWVFPLYRGVYG